MELHRSPGTVRIHPYVAMDESEQNQPGDEEEEEEEKEKEKKAPVRVQRYKGGVEAVADKWGVPAGVCEFVLRQYCSYREGGEDGDGVAGGGFTPGAKSRRTD